MCEDAKNDDYKIYAMIISLKDYPIRMYHFTALSLEEARGWGIVKYQEELLEFCDIEIEDVSQLEIGVTEIEDWDSYSQQLIDMHHF